MPHNYLAVKWDFGYYRNMTRLRLPENLAGFRIHMVGIKGTGMAALAELLVSRGAILTGSDVSDVFYTDEILKSLGIRVMSPFQAANLSFDAQLVIYSSAYKTDVNPELIEALSRKLPTLLYSEALGEFSAHSYSCGIAGVHGKTTTTGLAGTIVKGLGLEASALAGSVISGFGNHCTMVNGSKYFIAETCEYQRHFMAFHPKKILLTSIESDHQDCYPTYEAILSAFMQYINLLPQYGELIYCADDPGACEAAKMIFSSRPDIIFTAYGEKAIGDYHLEIKGVRDERLVFSLKGFTGDFKLRVPGHHNAKNAAGAIALAISLLKEDRETPVSFTDIGKIREALETFTGSRRRSEIVGEAGGVLVIDDYGHHPTAVSTTLAGLKEFYPGKRLVVDFMSHTYSRTAALLPEFAASFTSADEVILHKIYASAREQYDGTVSGKTLYDATKSKHKNVHYFEEVMDARSYLNASLRPGDLLVTMGAGDNWRLGQAILEDRRQKLSETR
jgi:UDP-N-acetylmuramate--alanine ligase